MASRTQIPSRVPRISRLNPFLFPSDTDFRFVLLVFSILGSTLFIYNTLSADFLSSQITTTLHCTHLIQAHTLADMEIAQRDNMQCQGPYLHLLLEWLCGGMALVLILAFLLYWFSPAWKIWREKLEPMSVEDVPDVVAYLKELCQEAGLVTSPLFVWKPLNQASSGLAFGHFRQYYIFLSGGLVTQYYTDKASFRAILLHELAHLRNADVNKTYFTVAIWHAFVLAALVPFAVYIVRLPLGILPTFNVIWRLLALTALVYLTRNAVLRSREFYADVRASTWNNVVDALGRILNVASPTKERPPMREYWQRLMHLHPEPVERYRVLNDTRPLFHMGFWEAFGAGIVTGVAIPNVQALLEWLFYSWQVDSRIIAAPQLLSTAVIFTPFIMGTVGLNVWRAAFAASAQGEAALRGAGRLGLCLGLGIILGLFLALPNFLESSSFAILTQLLVYNLIWNVLLLIVLFGFFKWIASGAFAWLAVVTTSRSLRVTYSRGLVLAGLVLLGLVTQILQLGTIIAQLLLYPIPIIVVVVKYSFVAMLLQPITLLIIVILWAFPLATWFWRNQCAESGSPSWATIDSPSPQVSLPRRNSLQPGLALMIGLVGGFVFCLILLILWTVVHKSWLGPLINSSVDYVDIYYYSQIWFAAILQAGIAVLVSIIVSRQGILHGLLAAFVSGCVMVVGLLTVTLIFGGTTDSGYIWQTICFIINGGSLLAIVASAVAVWISRQIVAGSVTQAA